MSSLQNHIEFRLRGTLLVGGTTVNVTNDLERDQVITATNASVVLRDRRGDVLERMVVNFASGVMTIVSRGLDQSDGDNAISSLQREWRDGTRGFITALASQITDKRGDNDFLADNTFTGTLDFNGSSAIGRLEMPRLTTTERNALTSVEDGTTIFNTTDNIGQQFFGGIWNNLGGGGTVVDASETVAGKVEISTQSEFDAGTDTGTTGAFLTPKNSQINAVNSTQNTNISNNTTNIATNTASIATNTTNISTNTAEIPRFKYVTATRNEDTTSGTVSYTHGLNKTPQVIIAFASSPLIGVSGGTTSSGIWTADGQGRVTHESSSSSNDVSNIIFFQGRNFEQFGSVSATSTTTFSIDWVRGSGSGGNPASTARLLFLVIA